MWRLVKGPGTWVRPSDLQQLHHWFGLPWEFDWLEDIFFAAQLRVLARAGQGGEGGSLGIRACYQRWMEARRTTSRWDEEVLWDFWSSNNCIANLWNNKNTLASQGITVASLENELTGGMELPITRFRDSVVRKGFQAVSGASTYLWSVSDATSKAI